MFFKYIHFFFVIFFTINMIEANSRVSFSRPGAMMRIPSVDNSMKNTLFKVNLSSEVLSSNQNSSAFSFTTQALSGYQYSVSYVTPVQPSNTIEFGFHVQKSLAIYESIILDAGIHDILFRQSNNEEVESGLDTKGLSLFGVITSQKSMDLYSITTHLGFGSGKISIDSHLYEPNQIQKIGIFLGFEMKTPYLKDNGGIDFLVEYDGQGLNVGSTIPITKAYNLNLGITHFEKFGDFATEDREGSEYMSLEANAPSITLGLSMSIPRLNIDDTAEPLELLGDGIYSETDTSILYYDPICTEVVELLRDSIQVERNKVIHLESYNLELLHGEAILEDSTRKFLLKEQVSQSNQNKAMRALSRSLRYFYQENYRNALLEANSAIELNPNLAIAYGRRGSIYYKLGDKRRATLNWNVALQLDPEFTEIYEMLKAADENRLEPLEIGKIQENN